ncbi:hypothetical protein SAMN04488128_10953 [Chitinophaga eiseniae]|uniref:Uncharacterized protein n=1 Tax=Chitinophaga eiseniae TaxID=634771 RepID=A0A1T4U568_9BACT|nr:hypothetical protein [Chitinophaga eiseniae]SKA47814.1 hypothetical protein SAMN04488128_10953 [Chitinophaga eiseniae]
MKWMFLPLFWLLYNSTQAQPRPADYRRLFQQDPALHKWAASTPHFTPEAFVFLNATDFGKQSPDTLRGAAATTYFDTFGKLISYSPDRKQWLDFYSYQVSLEKTAGGRYRATLEADQALRLGKTNDNTHIIIAYMGASTWIEETAWVDNHTFIAVGVNSAAAFHPFIFIGDTNTRKIYHYSPRDKRLDRSGGYVSYQWAKMRPMIIEE